MQRYQKWGIRYKVSISNCLFVQPIPYGKPLPGAESHYEFCCSFPQNAHTLCALDNSIFIRFLFRLLRSSDLDLVTALSWNLGTEGFQKSQNIFFTFGYNSG